MKNQRVKLQIELYAAINNSMASFNKKCDELLEGFNFIRTIKREFYPKNFKLSENFVKAFKDEYKRLIDEGHHPRKAIAKINKALLFHTSN